jgi:hypothetical protein
MALARPVLEGGILDPVIAGLARIGLVGRHTFLVMTKLVPGKNKTISVCRTNIPGASTYRSPSSMSWLMPDQCICPSHDVVSPSAPLTCKSSAESSATKKLVGKVILVFKHRAERGWETNEATASALSTAPVVLVCVRKPVVRIASRARRTAAIGMTSPGPS